MEKRTTLSARQKAFVKHYLDTLNIRRAGILAGYSEGQGTSDTFSHPLVIEAIGRELDKRAMTKSEVLARLAEHARGSIEDLMDEDGDISVKAARRNNALHLIKKYKRTSRQVPEHSGGGVEVTEEFELYDAQAALVQLGRSHALFIDRTKNEDDGRVAELRKQLDEVKRERAELEKAEAGSEGTGAGD